VLIAGGCTLGLLGVEERTDSTPTSEIFDPETQSTIVVSSMEQPRGYHAATLLKDGRVMLSGGLAGRNSLSGIEFYDPKLGRFEKVRNLRMNEGRFFHTMTLLSDGRVLITGGFDQSFQALASAEIFDPESSTVALLPNLNEARGAHSAVLFNQRWVLLAGGSERYSGGLFPEENLNGKSLRSTEVFDTIHNRFVTTASLKVARGFHQSCVVPGERSWRVFFGPGMGEGEASASVEYMDLSDLPDGDDS
jgi:hypothetical protein